MLSLSYSLSMIKQKKKTPFRTIRFRNNKNKVLFVFCSALLHIILVYLFKYFMGNNKAVSTTFSFFEFVPFSFSCVGEANKNAFFSRWRNPYFLPLYVLFPNLERWLLSVEFIMFATDLRLVFFLQ